MALSILVGPITYQRMILGHEITAEFLEVVIRAGIAALRSTVAATVS